MRVTFRLDAVMDGSVTFTGESIIAGAPETILAVDLLGPWGDAFEFSVGVDGEWSASAIWANRLSGGWEDMGSGGSRGAAWSTPWRPPADGWGGSHLLAPECLPGPASRHERADDPPVHWPRRHGLGQTGATVSRPFEVVRSRGDFAARIFEKMPTFLGFWLAFERVFW